MPSRTLVDAGPLVSFLRVAEEDHEWAVAQFKRFPRFVTCEAVIAEACARLNCLECDPRKVVEMVEAGALVVDFDLNANAKRVHSLMEKYSDLPMDFADACLVTMMEIHPDSQIVTIDRNDIITYRRNGRVAIPAIFPLP